MTTLQLSIGRLFSRILDCFLYSIFSLDQTLSWALHGLMGDDFIGRSTVVLPCVSEPLDENLTSTEENQVTVNQTFEDETGTRQVASVLI